MPSTSLDPGVGLESPCQILGNLPFVRVGVALTMTVVPASRVSTINSVAIGLTITAALASRVRVIMVGGNLIVSPAVLGGRGSPAIPWLLGPPNRLSCVGLRGLRGPGVMATGPGAGLVVDAEGV